MARELLDAGAVADQAATLDDAWAASTTSLDRSIEFPSFGAAVEFVARMAPVAEGLNHHPDLTLSWRNVRLSLSTHSAGGVTELDFRLARALDPIIADLTAA